MFPVAKFSLRTSKVDIRLPGTSMAQGRSTKIISMIKWIRASRLSRKNSLSSLHGPLCGERASRRSIFTVQKPFFNVKRPKGPQKEEHYPSAQWSSTAPRSTGICPRNLRENDAVTQGHTWKLQNATFRSVVLNEWVIPERRQSSSVPRPPFHKKSKTPVQIKNKTCYWNSSLRLAWLTTLPDWIWPHPNISTAN